MCQRELQEEIPVGEGRGARDTVAEATPYFDITKTS